MSKQDCDRFRKAASRWWEIYTKCKTKADTVIVITDFMHLVESALSDVAQYGEGSLVENVSSHSRKLFSAKWLRLAPNSNRESVRIADEQSGAFIHKNSTYFPGGDWPDQNIALHKAHSFLLTQVFLVILPSPVQRRSKAGG